MILRISIDRVLKNSTLVTTFHAHCSTKEMKRLLDRAIGKRFVLTQKRYPNDLVVEYREIFKMSGFTSML